MLKLNVECYLEIIISKDNSGIVTFMYLILTIKKQAAIKVALILTSKSIGNVMPKLSASVKYSFTIPLHCFLICPTGVSPSAEYT